MKLTYPLAALAAALTLAGCDQAKPPESTPTPALKTNASAADVKKEVKEAVDTARNYVADNKDQFLASTEQKFKELDLKIDELGKKAETLTTDAKAEVSRALDALHEQRTELGQKFDDLKKSSQEAWKDAKTGFESAWAELEKAYDNAKSKFGY
ncbi:MAG: hypothetical protein HY301_06155 [Verrucomicrobia bacterium]|nr:hypothetical protein [Verrucomicrobiota bacterium]